MVAAGDLVNSYNDGRDPITGTVLGPFYELETSSARLNRDPSLVVHLVLENLSDSDWTLRNTAQKKQVRAGCNHCRLPAR